MSEYASFYSPVSGISLFSEPDILHFRNAFYICGWNNFDHLHGVYSQEGYLIPQAAFHCHWPPVNKGQRLWSDPNVARGFPVIKSAIFVGHMHEQYGHFITEFLSRLWVAKQIWDGTQKLIVRAIKPKADLFKVPWLVQIIEALGFAEDDFYFPETSVTIENLVVASPLFTEDSVCYAGMAEFCNSIGFALNPVLPVQTAPERIYLSRSKLICGTVRIDNEHEFERELEQHNFRIVHPQDLSVSEQVELYRNDNFIVGQIGSAFHTSIFVPAPQGICLKSKVYGGIGTPPALSYRVMDQVNGSAFEYLDFPGLIESSDPNGNFYENMTISDVELAASILSDRIAARETAFYLSNMGRRSCMEAADLIAYELIAHNGNAVASDLRTGQASTYIGDTVEKLLLVTQRSKIQDARSFLVSAHPDAPALMLGNTMRYGPALPVHLEFLDGGKIALRSCENNAYIFACDDQRGQGLFAEGPQIMAWEKYVPLETSLHLHGRASRRHALLSLIALFHYGSSLENLAYYQWRHSDLVAYVSGLSTSFPF
ncbi:glycosyltransferase 61 family protein [Asaia lannensis]|uniref:Glycosyltransferase family 61 protein n=1 Tax=Asaia lannensis NBRC 102526 TaxID=1307926 RepID=A0ABT1CI77_9PROT|nr:glycosyltransferase 61 family protein [Asaia lannensis]MCO6160563.1 glycosyltransferase family 61 protein [Asaia lannensis NBRC 102526]